MRQRNLADAQNYYLQALFQAEALSIHDARVRSALGNLLHVAERYQRKGDYAEAEKLIRVVVEQASVGRLAEFNTAEPVFAAQATHYENEGRPEAAASLLEVGLHLYGSSAPSAINRRNELEALLGEAYLRLGQVAKASSLLLNAQKVAQSRFGPESVEAAEIAVPVAALYAQQGEFEKAERTNQNAVSILKVHDARALTLARAQSQLAQLYLEHGRAADALPHARSSAEILTQAQSATPLLVTTLTTLATAETRSGDLAAADRAYARALNAYEALPTDEHTEETIGLLDQYAAFARSRGRQDQANTLTQRAIRDRAALIQAAPTAEDATADTPNP
ncbi:tetratricopeptide repeat protein [Myxococcota bacterium]|nr:tetratricopeptide repeat protein [Myxococcota bacterium]